MVQKKWDVIIIGSGFGGSMTALQLAKAGLQVLVLERGRWVDRDASAWDVHAILIDRKYRSRTPYEADKWLGRGDIYPDEAMGGNSVFYGAASFRLREQDFKMHSRLKNGPAGDLSHVDWPIEYRDLAPFYDTAEQILEVAGSAGSDPTEPPRQGDFPQAPPVYSIPAQRLVDAGQELGLKPFPLPLAIHYTDSSDRQACELCSTCDLFPCKIEAKNDLSVTVLPEAVRHGAVVRPQTVAKTLLRKGDRITGVECLDLQTGEEFALECDLCVVSAGAIHSPRLLLASGLGSLERSGYWIGRNLMRHCSGIVIGLFPFKTNPEGRFNKQVGIADFYFGDPAQKRRPAGPWGMIQALQVPPPDYIRSQAPFPVGEIGARTTPYHMYLLCIAEDLPNPNNRVAISRNRKDDLGMPIATVFHQYDRRDLLGRRALYREAARWLRAAGAKIRMHKPIATYSHALGSCRFGHNPESAALDPWCRVFGMNNLFVVDGSFMPTSTGVNPSLTIAANALRVGQHLAAEYERYARGTASEA